MSYTFDESYFAFYVLAFLLALRKLFIFQCFLLVKLFDQLFDYKMIVIVWPIVENHQIFFWCLVSYITDNVWRRSVYNHTMAVNTDSFKIFGDTMKFHTTDLIIIIIIIINTIKFLTIIMKFSGSKSFIIIIIMVFAIIIITRIGFYDTTMKLSGIKFCIMAIIIMFIAIIITNIMLFRIIMKPFSINSSSLISSWS